MKNSKMYRLLPDSSKFERNGYYSRVEGSKSSSGEERQRHPKKKLKEMKTEPLEARNGGV